MKHKLCYLAHPVGPEPGRSANAAAALKLLRELNAWGLPRGRVFCAPWLATVLSGEPESGRETWLAVDTRLVRAHDELWLTGPEVTEGMRAEAEAFQGPTFRWVPGTQPNEADRVDVRAVWNKDQDGKSRVGLIPPKALLDVGHVLGYGVKYGENNWRNATGPEAYTEAAMRHILKDAAGEHMDEDTGRLHLAHGAADLLIATELRRK